MPPVWPPPKVFFLMHIFKYIVIAPKGPTQDHDPIMIGAVRTDRKIEYAVEAGYARFLLLGTGNGIVKHRGEGKNMNFHWLK